MLGLFIVVTLVEQRLLPNSDGKRSLNSSNTCLVDYGADAKTISVNTAAIHYN